MRLWARARQDNLLTHPALGVRAARRAPSLATFWSAGRTTPAGERERALLPLPPAERDLAIDGTRRRRSTRDATDALRVATLAGVTMGQVRAHRAVPDGDERAAALALLEAFPLAGAVISADAGPLRPLFVQKVVENKGAPSGSSRPISPTSTRLSCPGSGAGRAGAGLRADGHTPRTGRAPGAGDGVVRRPQPVSGPGVCPARRAAARLERTRWRAGREATRGHVWIAGAAFPWSLTPAEALARLQAHWRWTTGSSGCVMSRMMRTACTGGRSGIG